MKFRRQDETEPYQVDNASRNAFMFYTVALLIWSLLENFRTAHLGNEFLILGLGNAVYFTTLVVQNRKVNRFDEESIEGNKLRQFIKRNKNILLGVLLIIILVIIDSLIKK
ncbi:hypothetical protein P5808_29755 [Bacillus cereus]|uniref:hypothetical protein n=1 Tax=Bacillus cereus group TaxID=86661 RepID=UPI002407512E|nr:hypothetical protein [Bacillus cereus]MDF9507952.1 hypothetical protein [Bacillus cereus]MDF9598087.1 hypothetical protein [Bacillus cereus]MDF9609665.1 hypothetical protein [Bacillus cereus]MDF9660675.1 hypothetical protein [Bacillus cereus]